MSIREALLASVCLVTLAGCRDEYVVSPEGAPPSSLHHLASPGTFPESSPYGIDVSYGNDGLFGPILYDSLKAAGIGWVRIDFNWNEYTDPVTGAWNHGMEDALRSAVTNASARGMHVYGSINYAPNWATGHTDGVTYPPSAAYWGSYQAWVRKIVADNPEVRYWGVWNEPNCDGFFHGTEGEYHTMVAYASAEIHAAGRYVVAPDMAYRPSSSTPAEPKCFDSAAQRQWLANLLNSQGDNIDVVAIHIYDDAGAIAGHLGGTGTAAGQFVTSMTPLLAPGKTWKWPVWLTETGLGGAGWVAGSDTIGWAAMSSHLETVYNAMNARSASNPWAKTFYYHAYTDGPGTANSGIIGNWTQAVTSRNPADLVFKPAYAKYRQIATGFQPPQREIGYQLHQSYLGWQGFTYDGAQAGSTSATYAVEALRIRLVDMPTGSGVYYSAYVRGVGWTSEVGNGVVAGTTGQGRPIEGLKIRLADAPAGTSVCYSAYVPGAGWQASRCNNTVAGTIAAGKVVSAIKVWIVEPSTDVDDSCHRTPTQPTCAV
ncbi:MAG TPA: hypothetical protein VFH27_08345 [Longimicrobiaceae bacterium]|nr:hypothetical protein [Longimicrobiaceae bacterium]